MNHNEIVAPAHRADRISGNLLFGRGPGDYFTSLAMTEVAGSLGVKGHVCY